MPNKVEGGRREEEKEEDNSHIYSIDVLRYLSYVMYSFKNKWNNWQALLIVYL